MVKRQPVHAYLYAMFALLLMMMCWESNKSSAALLNPAIPKESIRLRILANSDTPEDQLMKHKVRDAVVAQMDSWVTGPTTIEQARQVVRDHLPELNALVEQKLQEYGYTYGEQTELGIVPFPTKMYGDRVYPAGDYEALRVTLGQGKGQNWWCVLFPPLCFVDAAAGEAVAKAKDDAGTQAKPQTQQETVKSNQASSRNAKPAANGQVQSGSKQVASAQATTHQVQAAAADKPEVKFFFWEMLKAFFSWIKGLFA